MAHTYAPQLARLVKHAPDGDEWLHEMKYDGYRIGCVIRAGDVRLITRNGNDWTAAFPEIIEAVQKLRTRDALLDGEAAIVMPDGRTSFQALQNAFKGGTRRDLVYFVFDLLRLDRENLERRPLEQRKEALLRLIGKPKAKTRIRYSEHVVGGGQAFFEEACRLRLEGIISKQRDAPYKSGRSDAWVKTKCVARQELVIGGFTDPEGSRQGIGALLVGYYDGTGALVFGGKVGTGFSVAVARDLRLRLEKIEQKTCPFRPTPPGWLGRNAHWVEPSLVAEVVFSEWTDDGKVRHPSFQGLRQDKDPQSVVREAAAEPPAGKIRQATRQKASKPEKARTSTPRRRSSTARASDASVAGVRISHPDRVLYPGTSITKLALAQFFERIADWILPHMKSRPLTLVRCPDGIAGECFYMKHSKVWAPPAVRRIDIQEKTKVGEYLIADTLPAIVSLVQMNVLEFHTWNTCEGHLEHPDRIVFDIDPGARVSWKRVVAAARLVRSLLERLDLESFPKTTGGKGLHVVVPVAPRAEWQDCLAFSRALASAIERSDPDLYTTAFAKAGREGKILIDYLRNNRTNTSVAAFSARAREGAPVSVTLRWDELTASLEPSSFTVVTVEQRLRRSRADPWQAYWKSRQRLTRSAMKAVNSL
jgi:bifunctional non-homologous end joining protein LigD